MKKLLLIVTLAFAGLPSQTQDNTLDSLQNVLKTAKHDTIKYNAYMRLGYYYQSINFDTAIFYHTQATKIASNISGAEGELKKGESIRQKGWDYYIKDDYDQEFSLFQEALTIAEKYIADQNKSIQIKGKTLQASVLGNIGGVFKHQGDYSKALDYYFKSLKIMEELGNKRGQAVSIGNIGIIYANQGDYSKTLDYYFKALKIFEESGNKSGQASIIGNIGNVYDNLENHSKALEYHFRALKINKELGDKLAEATNLSSIGAVYYSQDDYTKTIDYCSKALKLFEQFGSKSGQATILGNMGIFYLEQKKYALAEKHLKQAEQLNRETGIIYSLKDNCSALSNLYTQTGRHKEALHYYKEHILLRDSINSEENQKAAIQKEMQFNFDKKAATDSIANVKEAQIKNVEIAKQKAEINAKKNQQYALFGGLFLVLVFAGFMYNRFKVTQKQKSIIEEKERETHAQKEIIEEKHKEITDSINYAERIQRSFLATKELLDENLGVASCVSPFQTDVSINEPNYFVFFRPKDVVSGDFYWASKLNNGNFAICCADSTGHGVPGAIMSILNISSLEKSIENETEPHHILYKTREIIIDRLKKDGSPEGGKDGMDCTLLCINPEKTKLTFAAANNPVFIVRTNKNGETELIEVKPDKMPVGKHDKDKYPFTLHTFDLQKGDLIYTLTDGMPDQFGGSKGKKYMIKNLKNFILNLSSLPMYEQEEKLANEFSAWKGNLEQIDDVCIISVRI